MDYSPELMQEFVTLLARHTPQEGLNWTPVPELGTFRETAPQDACPLVYEPAIIILGQGKKHCYLDGEKYDYSAGRYMTLFLPLPIDVQVVEATPEEPLLAAGIRMDLLRVANILVKMDGARPAPPPEERVRPTALIAEPLNDGLLDPVVRLLRTLDDPQERAVLREPLLDEIYFRLIRSDHSGTLRQLLQHRGQVQVVAGVVDHIQQHMDEVVSVDGLAEMANMSTSSFRRLFRELVHMPPLQYAKQIKLNRAQALIREGRNAGEAGHMVGYNSPAQFSREYKRHFGYSPSATPAA